MRRRLSRGGNPSGHGGQATPATVKVDSLLERKIKEREGAAEAPKGFMTITFLGFYDKKREWKIWGKIYVE